MSINMTIKSGTTRTFPQEGDSDLFGQVTSWASDVTNAINTSPTLTQTATFDAVVGSAANVTAGIATHSDIITAIAAVSVVVPVNTPT
jgi:PKD repeat protein